MSMFPFNETVIAQIFYADSALQQNGFVRIIDVRITAYLLLHSIAKPLADVGPSVPRDRGLPE